MLNTEAERGEREMPGGMGKMELCDNVFNAEEAEEQSGRGVLGCLTA